MRTRDLEEENQTIRCFSTKCNYCGRTVLYWENKKGSKVFFDYPIIEKCHQHICKIPRLNAPETSINERVYANHHLDKFQCPICGKIFDIEKDLMQHLKDRKRTNPIYQNFFNNILLFDVLGNDPDQNVKLKVEWKFGNSAQFGKMNIRKKSKLCKNS